MKRLPVLILCVLLAALPARALGAEGIGEQADGIFEESRTIGGALAVTMGGRIVYQRYYGYQDLEALTPVTEDTYFRVASVTKMVSAIGLMQLKEQGLVELDADISRYFGYEIANAYFPDTPLTMRQLMSHTAALKSNGFYETGAALRSLLSRKAKHYESFLNQVPGSAYEYSNFGAGIAGAVMEAVTGESVNRYIRDNVFAPLSIDASYDPAALSDPACVSAIYLKDGKRYRSAEYLLAQPYGDYADPERHYGATVGSLWIRAKDLATLTVALCGDGTVNGVRLLTAESLAQMMDDQASYRASVTGQSPYGLFVQREDTLLAGHTLYGHQGVFAGVLCSVYFEPASRFGFVLLTNGCDNETENGIGVLARKLFTLTYEAFVGDGDYQPWLVK